MVVWTGDQFVARRLLLQATPEDRMLRNIVQLFAVSLCMNRPLHNETSNVARSLIPQIYLSAV